MTDTATPTVTENSVFSVIVQPERCDEGKELFREWSTAVKNERNVDECLRIFWGPRKYDEHRKGCVACTEYEYSKIQIRIKATEELVKQNEQPIK